MPFPIVQYSIQYATCTFALDNVHIAHSMPRIYKGAYFNSANSERGPIIYNMQNPRRAGKKGETVYLQSGLTITDPVVTESG